MRKGNADGRSLLRPCTVGENRLDEELDEEGRVGGRSSAGALHSPDLGKKEGRRAPRRSREWKMHGHRPIERERERRLGAARRARIRPPPELNVPGSDRIVAADSRRGEGGRREMGWRHRIW